MEEGEGKKKAALAVGGVVLVVSAIIGLGLLNGLFGGGADLSQ